MSARRHGRLPAIQRCQVKRHPRWLNAQGFYDFPDGNPSGPDRSAVRNAPVDQHGPMPQELKERRYLSC